MGWVALLLREFLANSLVLAAGAAMISAPIVINLRTLPCLEVALSESVGPFVKTAMSFCAVPANYILALLALSQTIRRSICLKWLSVL